ncbi:hypothetical protein WJX77_012308 [Trebouxia sp. C0004]
MHSFQVQHASLNDHYFASIKRTRVQHAAYQPEDGLWLDQENGAPDHRGSSYSFIWDYWHKSGAHKSANKHSATCKFCQQRIQDGRIPRLQEHTLDCAKVSDETKLEVRRLIEAEYKSASVSDVTDYWMFVAESLQHELHCLIQPKAAARQCLEALNRRSLDLKDPICCLCSFLDPKHKVLKEDGEEESLLR